MKQKQRGLTTSARYVRGIKRQLFAAVIVWILFGIAVVTFGPETQNMMAVMIGMSLFLLAFIGGAMIWMGMREKGRR